MTIRKVKFPYFFLCPNSITTNRGKENDNIIDNDVFIKQRS